MMPFFAAAGPLMTNPLVAKALSKIPDSTLLRVLGGPLFDLHDCYVTIIKHKRAEARYLFQFVLIITAIITAAIVPVVSEVYKDWISTFLIPTGNSGFLRFYFSAWLLSYPSNAIFKAGSFLYLLHKYGDGKYFLTKSRVAYLAKCLEVREDDVLSIFLFIRDNYSDGTLFINPKSGDLTLVLDRFMYGSFGRVLEDYHRHIGFYEASLLKAGNKNLLRDDARMESLAQIYQVSPETLKAVLQYCLFGIDQNFDTVGSTPADFSDIIAKILTGSLSGVMAFIKMHELQMRQVQDLELLQRKNARMAEQLVAIREGRSPRPRAPSLAPSFAGTEPYRRHSALKNAPAPERPIELEQGEEEKFEQERVSAAEQSLEEGQETAFDLGTMAQVLVKLKRAKNPSRKKSRGPESSTAANIAQEVVSMEPDGELRINNQGIDVVLRFLQEQMMQTSSELERMPPPPPPAAVPIFNSGILPQAATFDSFLTQADAQGRTSNLRTAGLYFTTPGMPRTSALGATTAIGAMVAASSEGSRSAQMPTRRLGETGTLAPGSSSSQMRSRRLDDPLRKMAVEQDRRRRSTETTGSPPLEVPSYKTGRPDSDSPRAQSPVTDKPHL